jgi:hypothetical protein
MGGCIGVPSVFAGVVLGPGLVLNFERGSSGTHFNEKGLVLDHGWLQYKGGNSAKNCIRDFKMLF